MQIPAVAVTVLRYGVLHYAVGSHDLPRASAVADMFLPGREGTQSLSSLY